MGFGWNRLENLLVQGSKDRDFSTKEALQPVLKLLLGPDGVELRALVVKEAVCVTEAVLLGTLIDTYNSIPEPIKSFVSNGNAVHPLRMNDDDRERMLELRATVFRIWGLLMTSQNFDPAILFPILQVLQEPEVLSLGGMVVGGVSQRLSARLLQQLLLPPTSDAS